MLEFGNVGEVNNEYGLWAKHHKKKFQRPFRCFSTLGMVLYATHLHPKLFGKNK
jgi:hypothetical protein